MVDLDADLSTQVARMVSDSGELRKAARLVENRARSLAGSHVKTGNYVSSFGTSATPGKSGVTDYVAYNDDPQAAIIEFGHNTRSGKRVPGQHIMIQAAHSV